MISFKYVAFIVLISSSLVHARNQDEECKAELVETIPVGMKFNTTEEQLNLTSTTEAFLGLIDSASESIEIAAFYWTMLCGDLDNSIKESCSEGEAVINSLVNALERKVRVVITVDAGFRKPEENADLNLLKSHGAEILEVNLKRFGTGSLHVKFIIVDRKSFYLGSANMDWRSLTEVKETGIVVLNCPQLTCELVKIFQVYVILGQPNATVPTIWPKELQTQFNISNPMKLKISGQSVKAFLSASPPWMNPLGTVSDHDAILHAIKSAESFIGIEVMDYSPSFLSGSKKYWPVIDNALREAVYERPVQIQFLASKWKYTKKELQLSLKSLAQLSKLKGSLNAKLISTPATEEQAKVAHSRVNHSKFIVTDKLIYIGTSNWSADYFLSAAGVGLTIMYEDGQNDQLRALLMAIHQRDWNSEYSHDLD